MSSRVGGRSGRYQYRIGIGVLAPGPVRQAANRPELPSCRGLLLTNAQSVLPPSLLTAKPSLPSPFPDLRFGRRFGFSRLSSTGRIPKPPPGPQIAAGPTSSVFGLLHSLQPSPDALPCSKSDEGAAGTPTPHKASSAENHDHDAMAEAAPKTAVTVVFYADYRRAAGTRAVEIEVPLGARVRDILALVASEFPGLSGEVLAASVQKGLDSHMLVAIDGRLVAPDAVVCPGDELKLLPPISGG